MGDPKKQRKKYKTPRHPWQKDRIESELRILGKYGLRNKRSIWKFKTKVEKFRTIAKRLLALSAEESLKQRNELLSKLNRLGILPATATLDDILSLTIEDLLERRLQTIVVHKGLATTMDQSRQFIVHGHITLSGIQVTSPSHIVLRKEEDEVTFSPTSPLANPEHKIHAAQADKA
ncbi:MAG TPA: 30S ribosomal protein S4 [Candidatus Deferrimicrobium sp.]|nr:30S ribosomal protein S4 [Candidatus Deferrimicrobium sp.]